MHAHAPARLSHNAKRWWWWSVVVYSQGFKRLTCVGSPERRFMEPWLGETLYADDEPLTKAQRKGANVLQSFRTGMSVTCVWRGEARTCRDGPEG